MTVEKLQHTAQRGWPYYGLQAAEDGSVDEHLADLDVDRQAGQVVSQRGEEMVGGVTRSNLPQQVDSVAD